MNKQYRNVCWTYFIQYSEDTEQDILSSFEDWDICTYTVFQWEICPETQKTHVQGYSEFSSGVRGTTLAKRFPGIHLEARQGTAAQAAKYCQKDESRMPDTFPSEFGQSKGGQGTRSDLAAATQLIANGATMKEVAQSDMVGFVRHHRGYAALANVLLVQQRTWKPTVVVYWGPPGTGKTRSVYEKHGFGNVYEVPTPRSGSEVWFDGYSGQETILVDDFYGWLRWSFLLKFIDRYPQGLPIKGNLLLYPIPSSVRLPCGAYPAGPTLSRPL